MSGPARSRSPRLVAFAVAAALAGCGGDGATGPGGGGHGETGTGDGTPAARSGANPTERLFAGSATDNLRRPAGGRRGGELTVLSAGDVDFLDPGKTYYVYSVGILNALHRGLYTYAPGDPATPVPDLARSDPAISRDGRTVTVHLRRGIRFSAPVSREVKAGDVKYAIERAFTGNVANGYAGIYFDELVGAPKGGGAYAPIRGIETPDDSTLVFRLKRPTGAVLAGALAMPITIPVPKEFALEHDRRQPSAYGEAYAVFTGPYRIPADSKGKLTGFQAGRRLQLVRNPDYADAGDFRPAYLDALDFRSGNDDAAVATQRILSGESLASGELHPPASRLQRLLKSDREQLSVVSGGGWRAISLDTTRPPFDDLDVRKAVIAGFDRVALRQQRGGEALGPIAQHYIPPGMAGFDESNGPDGWPEFDWMRAPAGDRSLAAEYFKRAGHSSGRYEGDERLLLVADGAEPDRSIAQIADQQLQELGFETKLRLVSRDTMLVKFCTVPRSEASVCPSYGWAQDFADPQTVLDPTFNGRKIVATNNSNWAELRDPALERAMTAAEVEVDPAGRARAWAEINKRIVSLAPAIPYMWDYQSAVVSPDVRGVQNGYSTTWDWSFTSLR